MSEVRKEQRRNCYGNVIQDPPPFAKAGENSNPSEYADKKGAAKTNPTGSCVLKDGTPKYASDGCTILYDPKQPHTRTKHDQH
jgi:hypothetical protein